MITADDVEREVRRIASEQPDRAGHGERCIYFDGTEPSCLFGHAFAALGLDGNVFLGNECNSSGLMTAWQTVQAAADLQPWHEIPTHQRGWLLEVQSQQDDRIAWSQCILIADEQYPKTADGHWPYSGQ